MSVYEKDPGEYLHTVGLRERRTLADILRTETVGGFALLFAATVALLLANSPLSDVYAAIRDFHFGPEFLHLHLSAADWAKDGLLTIFFFVAGVELKREFVDGELRDPKAAALPIAAAVGGMVVPALIYVGFNAGGRGDLGGWAIPMATDIAFALGVLAVLGTALPTALRAFLLTLAVVDDLLAIIIIAIFYTSSLNLWALAGAIAGLALFRYLLRRGITGWYIYVPLAAIIWALAHTSGIHATIAGVAMGLLLRCKRLPGEKHSQGEHVEHLVRPISAGLAAPLFAFFAAGVAVSGEALRDIFTRPETLGVVLGLFAGKAIGVFLGAWLTVKLTKAELSPDLKWPDVFAVAALAGIGFTVSLLIGELSFAGNELAEPVKASVLVGTAIAMLFSAMLLRMRSRHYRQVYTGETADLDQDGIPDIFEKNDPAYHLHMAEIYERKAVEHRTRATQILSTTRVSGSAEPPPAGPGQ